LLKANLRGEIAKRKGLSESDKPKSAANFNEGAHRFRRETFFKICKPSLINTRKKLIKTIIAEKEDSNDALAFDVLNSGKFGGLNVAFA
jgi:hypothetical protein